MKLQFKDQTYQTEAVDAVVDCFAGQPFNDGVKYLIDPGTKPAQAQESLDLGDRADWSLRNAEILLDHETLLGNIKAVQHARGLPASENLEHSVAAPAAPNLDVEMETGTGKTYVYIKTIMELHQRYGWSKFIVVVPSIAIREGVKKTFEVTAEHFQERYGTKPRAFIYDSSQLHEVEHFSADGGIQVMIINIQAFNATGKDARRIYEELDDFQSRRPLDVIAANRPIVIIDEPQKIGAKKSLEALSHFNALMVLRYSATHRVEHNKVHRLDALDAYNRKLVKRITVRGITVKGLAGISAYLYLDHIEVAKGTNPRARIELEVQTSSQIKRQLRWVAQGTRLHDLSNGIEAYNGLVVTEVDPIGDVIRLSNGDVIAAGQLSGADVVEESKRRIQIREVITAHLAKERTLYSRGIKVLSLFFIDEVAKYRDYTRDDTLGDYARIFEEEYAAAVTQVFNELPLDDATAAWRSYLERDAAHAVHQGYFSIDKKTGNLTDPKVAAKGDERGNATDVDAYDLILKDKERLLSMEEPVRFIFSHSALREGWDNPNVFVMGMLKKSDNTISRRQEIGRGLRICVDQHGERQDDPATVHDINVLTVVTDESYTAFVDGLQREIAESLAGRPTAATATYFAGRKLIDATSDITVEISEEQAKDLLYWLRVNKFVDKNDQLTDTWHDLEPDAVPDLPDELQPFHAQIIELIEGLATGMPAPADDRKLEPLPLNKANFERKEFKELWKRINHKAVYQVAFDTDELVTKAAETLDANLAIAPLQYVIKSGTQAATIESADLVNKAGFTDETSSVEVETTTASSKVPYDLIGEITEKTELTRRTASRILQKIQPSTFAKFRQNPEQFIIEASRLINEQKGAVTVEHLVYDLLDDTYDSAIFTENQTRHDLSALGKKLTKHVYDYAVVDSGVERDFVTDLDSADEVAVYAKLPRGFKIPTPVGDYNPDWAIAFTEGKVKHVYFVAETKGSLSTLQLKGAEQAKIESARKFFKSLEAAGDHVTYGVVETYGDLLNLVAGTT